ncbi:6-bladed beta-propeller [Perlabentimonas gracilis]|uniref:6-bladed beta-propeller n=1 Tax=Perlabentimonas gracilis TaxID=2715279 RepID=UPI00140A64A8|nr:6-bladed beta-propeller [Perlabentimonas gracilis]NHB70244.1 6-bladed beta-propeller [Perlabentimonas gracilis]
MKPIAIISIIVIALYSCNNSKENLRTIIVDMNKPSSESLSTAFAPVEMIPLETHDHCMVARIVNIKKTSSYLFVNDAGQRVLQFDLEGNFVRRIGKQGKGPGEYLGVNGIAIDSIGQTIYITSRGHKVLQYDLDGNYKADFTQTLLPEFMDVIDDELWLIATMLGERTPVGTFANTTSLIRYTLQGVPIDTLSVKRLEFPFEQGAISPSHWCISNVHDGRFIYYPVLLSEPVVRDTLYHINANGLRPYCKVNFGISGEKALEEYFKITNMFMVNNTLMVNYNHMRQGATFYCNRNTGIKRNLPHGFDDDLWNTGNVMLTPLDPMTGLVYFTKEAYEMYHLIENINEDDNPVVFIMKAI